MGSRAANAPVDHPANPYRGEAELRIAGRAYRLRPSFASLVAAEGELGSLLGLVERAANRSLGIDEIAALFWHLIDARPDDLNREAVGQAIVAQGLAATTPALRLILRQILQGAGGDVPR
jgi:hypothetical protein